MTKENEDALRCADALQSGDIHENAWQSAAHLRRLVAENESATALVRQMLEALEPMLAAKLADGTYADKDCKITFAITAAREWLENGGAA